MGRLYSEKRMAGESCAHCGGNVVRRHSMDPRQCLQCARPIEDSFDVEMAAKHHAAPTQDLLSLRGVYDRHIESF